MGKGGDFERYVAKTLTKWLTGREKPYKYWRMPGSGGLATIHEECSNLTGDIRALSADAEFLTDRFSVECKTGYPSTSFWQHFKTIKHFPIKLFWAQCVNDAYHAQKEPMLIYRKKGKQIILGLSAASVFKLEYICDQLKVLSTITMRFELEELPNITFYDFNDFWEAVKPDDIRNKMG